jgi:hypothetical protein
VCKVKDKHQYSHDTTDIENSPTHVDHIPVRFPFVFSVEIAWNKHQNFNGGIKPEYFGGNASQESCNYHVHYAIEEGHLAHALEIFDRLNSFLDSCVDIVSDSDTSLPSQLIVRHLNF